MIETDTSTKQIQGLSAEGFLRLHIGHEGSRLLFTLNSNERVLGIVFEHDVSAQRQPFLNRVSISRPGCPTDQHGKPCVLTELHLTSIKSVELVDD